METWTILPETAFEAPGPASEAFRRLGSATFRSAAHHVHELPYGRNSDRSDWRLVLSERRGTCSTKHALLATAALEQRLPVSLTVGIYDMEEANTPGVGEVLAQHGLRSIPEAHCFLVWNGRRVDVTRAAISPQAPIAFHREWTIEPEQIGAHKVDLHQRYLRDWLRERRDIAFVFEELWRIREQCIRAMGPG